MKHSERKKEIVETARRIISHQGMKSLTINAIARELKLTDGALYRHVKSKKEILDLLVREIEETLLTTVDHAARGTRGPLEKLETIFTSHLSYAEQRRGVTFLIITETLNIQDKELQKRVLAIMNNYIDRIGEILMEGVRDGSFRHDMDLSSAALCFWGMIQSTSTIWALSGYRYSLKKNHRRILDIYKGGILNRFPEIDGPAVQGALLQADQLQQQPPG
jgi:AcrR family transcriptional regulator